jgi:hypothetical protein
VRPLAVVFVLPLCDLASGIGQVSEPSSIQAFVSKSSVEAFDMTVLCGLAKLNVDELNLSLFAPAQEMATREFRLVVQAISMMGHFPVVVHRFLIAYFRLARLHENIDAAQVIVLHLCNPDFAFLNGKLQGLGSLVVFG